ncbi:hypothetical protein [Halarcobacter sp.]|uniref:hypothetical protein n=1 Tax=Halarcobacter sp. TaxID=2321133 RepID=UPI0029F50468|nr:hypothetical protein [Halarcobacter sp.]
MNAGKLIEKLILYFNVKNTTELATVLNTQQSTISGWKSRNAIGTLLEKLATIDENALYFLFKESEEPSHNIYIEDELISNSIRYRIVEKSKKSISNYQAELILMYRAFQSETVDLKNIDRNSLIQAIRNYRIELLKDKVQHGIIERNRTNAIIFIEELFDIEIDFISKRYQYFLSMLWEGRNLSNKHLSFE